MQFHNHSQYSHTMLFLVPSKVKIAKAELKHDNKSPPFKCTDYKILSFDIICTKPMH